MKKQIYFGLLGLFFSASLLGQNVPKSEFEEALESLLSPEISSSSGSVKPNGGIELPFDETDSVYEIVVLDSVKYDSLYNFFVVDSIYDNLTNEAFLKLVYYEKQSFEKLVIGNSYRIVTYKWKPYKFLMDGDTLYRFSCSYSFGKDYKRDCEDYSSGSKKQIENCIPVQYVYYEILKIVALDERSIKSKN